MAVKINGVPVQNLALGKKLRDDGIKQVSMHDVLWLFKVRIFLRALRQAQITIKNFPLFTGEDLRIQISKELGNPENCNMWGAVVLPMVKGGMLVKAGEPQQMKIPSSHARTNPSYRWGPGEI